MPRPDRPSPPTRSRRLRRSGPTYLALAAVVTIVLAACGSSSRDTKAAPTTNPPTTIPSTGPHPAGTYAVGMATRDWVDDTRTTDAHGGIPETHERRLDTVILYPVARTAAGTTGTATKPITGATPAPGRHPMIVFGHGSTRKPLDYVGKLSYWVSAGYVVVAPTFPLSSEGTPGGTAYGDYPNQTGDESFVIDRALADDTAPLHLASLIDAGAIGVGGQSFGAITALGTVASKCCADKRIRAATTFAAAWLPYASGNELAPWASKVPVLFVHGSADPTLPYDGDHDFFERLAAPGGFLTLTGSGHDPGFFDGTDTELDTLVSEATLAFYDQHLRDGPDATPIIEDLVKAAGPKVATFTPSP